MGEVTKQDSSEDTYNDLVKYFGGLNTRTMRMKRKVRVRWYQNVIYIDTHSVAGTVTGLVQFCWFALRMLGPPLPAHSGGQLPATQLENSSSVLFSLTP